jgi:acetyl esterase/lipase
MKFSGLVLLCWAMLFCAVSRAQNGFQVKSDVVYGHKDGMALTYDVFTPQAQAKGIGVLFMVSGGWVSNWVPPEQMASSLIAPLLQSGYTVITIRHGSSPKYLVPECVADVKLALQHVYEHAGDYAIDKSKLGVFGFSAGGHLSLILGTQSNDKGSAEKNPRVAAVAAVFPPTDLAPYVTPGNPRREQFPALKFNPDKAAEVSPLMHVSSDDAPTFLVHGDKDDLVPISHSYNIVEAFDRAGVKNELIVIEGAAHGFDAKGNKRMFDGIIKWFDQCLASQ